MLRNTKIFLELAKPLRLLPIEKIAFIFLDKKLQVLFRKIHTQRKKDIIKFTARSVFAPALIHNCSYLLVIHNHPSGSAFPSQSDYYTTLTISEGAHLLQIKLLDHLIVTEADYFSFREAGIL